MGDRAFQTKGPTSRKAQREATWWYVHEENIYEQYSGAALKGTGPLLSILDLSPERWGKMFRFVFEGDEPVVWRTGSIGQDGGKEPG